VRKPHKGCFGRSVLRYRSGEAKAKADRNSEVWAGSASNREGEPSTREEIRRSPDQGFRNQALEGQNPREVPVVVGLIPRTIARQAREA